MIDRVSAKVRHFHGRQYCAYMTPDEIIKLHDGGSIKFADGSSNTLDYIRGKRAKGESNPHWHYFEIKKDTPFEKAVLKRLGRKFL